MRDKYKEHFKNLNLREKKLNFLLVLLLVCIFTFSAAGITYALINDDTKEVVNKFQSKKYTNVEIKEPNGKEYEVNSEGNLTKPKSAYFSNPIANTKDEFIRAKVIKIIRNPDGSNAGISPNLSIEYTTDENWFEKDGYYYYKNIVKPGERTTELFSDIRVSEETLNTLNNGQTIEISVIADSIESNKVEEAWGFNPNK